MRKQRDSVSNFITYARDFTRLNRYLQYMVTSAGNNIRAHTCLGGNVEDPVVLLVQSLHGNGAGLEAKFQEHLLVDLSRGLNPRESIHFAGGGHS